jgi:hypothetical protein
MGPHHAHAYQQNGEYRAKYGKPSRDHRRFFSWAALRVLTRAASTKVRAKFLPRRDLFPLTPRVTEFLEHFRPAS